MGVLFRQSVKIKSIQSQRVDLFQPSDLCVLQGGQVRTSAIHAVLKQYQPMLLALEEMAHGHSESACRANGLFDRFQKGNVLLGLLLAYKSLKSLSVSVLLFRDGVLAAVNCGKDTIAKKRCIPKCL